MPTVAVVAYLFARRRGLDRSGTWALALTIGAAVLLVERLGYLTFTVDYARFVHDNGPLALTALQVAALAVVAAVLAPISVRALAVTRPTSAPVPPARRR